MADGVSLRSIAVPLAGLLALAGAVGLYLGLRAVPPTETQIIDAVAAGYVAETGGALTDCHAVPVPLEGVRMVVVCQPAEGAAQVYPVDAWGTIVEGEEMFTIEEPQT